MTKLEDLAISLTTILILYHDHQGINKLINETGTEQLRAARNHAQKILKQADYQDRLNEIITECTATGYGDRKPFLDFLLYEISFLSQLTKQEKPFSPEKLKRYQLEIVNLLTDLSNLLRIVKKGPNSFYNVTYSSLDRNQANPLKLPLAGLISDSMFSSSLCYSGVLVTNVLFDHFKLSQDPSSVVNTQFAETLCVEHQNGLLVYELEQQLEQHKALNTQQQNTLNACQAKIQQQEARIKELESLVESKTAQNSSLDQRVKDLSRSTAKPSPYIGGMFSPMTPFYARTIALTGNADKPDSPPGVDAPDSAEYK